MKQWKFRWDFSSATGQGKEGDVVELDDETAAHLNRESPGVLEPVAVETEARGLEEPPHDRQVKAAKTRTA